MSINGFKNAYWIGGPPGKTFEQIKAKLFALGVEIIGQHHKDYPPDSIPIHTDFVIINIEMIGHPVNWAVKEMCKKNDIPFVDGSNNKTRTISNLIERGLVQDRRNILEFKVIEGNKNQAENKTENKQTQIVGKNDILPIVPIQIGDVYLKADHQHRPVFGGYTGRPSTPVVLMRIDNQQDVAMFVSKNEAARYLKMSLGWLLSCIKENRPVLDDEYRVFVPTYEEACKYLENVIRMPPENELGGYVGEKNNQENKQNPPSDEKTEDLELLVKQEGRKEDKPQKLFKMKKLYGGGVCLEPLTSLSLVFEDQSKIPLDLLKFIEEEK